MKQCVSCFAWKEEEEFNWRYKSLGIRHPTCRDCHKVHRDKWYQGHRQQELERVKTRKYSKRDEARKYVYGYLSGHPCIECGESDPRVLEFHHKYGKDMPVSRMILGGYLIPTIQAEIDKCEVLCANCHRKKTMDERGWFRGNK